MKTTPEQRAEWARLAEVLVQDWRYDMHLQMREAIPALIADLHQISEELENEKARGIHSCKPSCTRDGCVNRKLRKDIEELQAKLAAAEKDAANHRKLVELFAKPRVSATAIHKYECRGWRNGKSYAPCTCGAVELQSELNAAIAANTLVAEVKQ